MHLDAFAIASRLFEGFGASQCTGSIARDDDTELYVNEVIVGVSEKRRPLALLRSIGPLGRMARQTSA